DKPLCEQKCVDLPIGYRCDCFEGFAIDVDDKKSCHNVNECYGRCRTEPVPWLMLANKHYIRKISIDGNNYEMAAQGFDNVVSLDVDLTEKKAYMVDQGKLRLLRVDLEEMDNPVTSYETVLRHNIFGIEGFAIDWVGRKIYMLNRQEKSIRVCELDGRFCRTLIRDRISQPKAIAIHPGKGYLFFTEWSLQPYIGRMALDGSPELADPIVKLAENDLGWPNALTIDYYSNR
ncbi:unnamed protein product, partial [Nippostrongylus brasiliensis]|uniref:LpR2 (inferred by orthology to a D. melanogaster protein) n=1 Tax=Nippostrongylus brasiliensis TaxID=27835 RepID=A0A0N4YXZ6_NIPBR